MLSQKLDQIFNVIGMPTMTQMIEDFMPIIKMREDLNHTPPFRKCKSRKWQRRRNKKFYRIMGGL